MSGKETVFGDHELVELLGDKSDLLAIADAIAAVGVRVDALERPPAGGVRSRWILRRPVLALVAAIFAVVVLAAPALAVSPRLRELVGLSNAPATPHLLVARITKLTIHYPPPKFAPPLATVRFTVGEDGKPPGAGVPDGSVIDVSFVGKYDDGPLIKAYGRRGHYRVTLRTPEGGITDILVGGFLNTTKGTPAANGTFWIPVINAYLPE
ncbi:MAG TPA: hypothetical protein VLJ44_12780 [Gaiellaceae bacterium]|nr:hypothetical protein [Gaiellaceae bacterium]